jgi:hypothetical protein
VHTRIIGRISLTRYHDKNGDLSKNASALFVSRFAASSSNSR